MSIHDVYDGSQVIAQSLDILNKYRVSLKVGEDFEGYRALLAEHRPDHDLGLPFDPKHQFMTPTNAFWIAGFGHDGELIHTQAMRMLELGRSTLASYMRENFLDFPPSGLPLDLKRSRYRPGPSAKRMNGRTVYHGEVWMGGTKGQFRGSGLSCVLGRFAFMTAMLRWSPDHFFGFMPRAVAFKGFAERQGYMHAEPGALRWQMSESDKVLEGFMVWMANEDVRHLMLMPLHELVQVPVSTEAEKRPEPVAA